MGCPSLVDAEDSVRQGRRAGRRQRFRPDCAFPNPRYAWRAYSGHLRSGRIRMATRSRRAFILFGSHRGPRARERARPGPRLPQQAGAHRGVVLGRRADRHRRAHLRRQALGAARPAILRREQGRRGRQYRRRPGREVRAGRLHAARRDGVDPRDQSRPLCQDAVRSGEGFRAGRAGRRDADHARRASLDPGEGREEPDRAGEGTIPASTPTARPAWARSFICAASSSSRSRAASTSSTCPIAAPTR